MNRIYLDANASAPASSEALMKIRESLALLGNPSSFHENGRILRAHIDEARELTAKALGARAKDLVFCSGASEANRLFVDMLILEAKKRNTPLNVVMTPFEHPSLLKPAIAAAKDGHFSLKIFNTNSDGRILFYPVTKSFDVLICCAAHNETGIIPDFEALLSLSDENTIVMSDIAQGFSRLEIPSERIDVLSFSAQKMGGFAGAGGIILRGRAKTLSAAWPGGGQERGFRPGTEATLLIMACGAAASVVEEQRRLMASLTPLRNRFEAALKEIDSECLVIGEPLPRLPNTSAIRFANQNPDALRIAFDMAGLSVGFGSACSGLAPTESFSLSRMGYDLCAQKTTVRFSFPGSINAEILDDVIGRIHKGVIKPGNWHNAYCG